MLLYVVIYNTPLLKYAHHKEEWNNVLLNIIYICIYFYNIFFRGRLQTVKKYVLLRDIIFLTNQFLIYTSTSTVEKKLI
jgi:hypothetical protein